MGPKTALTLVGLGALIGLGVYLDRKWTSNGGASGIAFNVAGTLWDSAVNGAQAIGGQLLDAMPSSQVPAIVDANKNAVNMANPVMDTGTLLYESALMGGGS